MTVAGPRVNSLTVQGFRAYGRDPQTLNFDGAPIAAVWGPNSKGKTSLAEAFEFLLTGRIVRRELMASSQDEFADALSNAHLPDGTEVFVSAEIQAPDASTHTVTRRLLEDYSKRQDCRSALEIDGAASAEAALRALGIVLSQPPLEAPVLAQHTLAYIFSARPQDRAVYFKTLLEVSDLDDFRNTVAGLESEITARESPLLTKFDRCSGIVELLPLTLALPNTAPGVQDLQRLAHDGAAALIQSAAVPVPEKTPDRLTKVTEILTETRSRAFPVRGFDRQPLGGWAVPGPDLWKRLESYLRERVRADEETQQLTALFIEALKLPSLAAEAEIPADCPLCGTEDALTPNRVALIRQHVESRQRFRIAESAARLALQELAGSCSALLAAVENALPFCLKVISARRRRGGFTVQRICSVLGEDAGEVLAPWMAQVRLLARAVAPLKRLTRALADSTADLAAAPGKLVDLAKIRCDFVRLANLHSAFAAVFTSYDPSEQAIKQAVNAVLDAQSDTAGWQDFLDICEDLETLHAALVERHARAAVQKELSAALKQIDRAKEQVLNDRFDELSGKIQRWWELLRPEEATFFSAVKPRPGGRRNIDFKAGLSPNPDRSQPKIRDVIAVFSQSQLHCLGLALFLARIEHDGAAFIVLDDPVLSADEDYRTHFDRSVVSCLMDLNIQIVILTQDEKSWRDLENLYRYRGILMAQLSIEDPSKGAVILNTSDELLARIARAQSLGRSGHPESRKEAGRVLRTAGELFCKELLVENNRAQGTITASWSDYDGKTLEWLCPRVAPFLTEDASHYGKLLVFKDTVNPPAHDDLTPTSAQMITAAGDLRYFVRTYLKR
jgi:hypothetical protein